MPWWAVVVVAAVQKNTTMINVKGTRGRKEGGGEGGGGKSSLTSLALQVPPYFVVVLLAHLLDKDPLAAPFHDTVPVVRTPRPPAAARLAAAAPRPRRGLPAVLDDAPVQGAILGPLDPAVDPLEAPTTTTSSTSSGDKNICLSLGTALVVRAKPRPGAVIPAVVFPPPPLVAARFHTGVHFAKGRLAPISAAAAATVLFSRVGTIRHRAVVRATKGGGGGLLLVRRGRLARVAPPGAALARTRAVEVAKGQEKRGGVVGRMIMARRGGEGVAAWRGARVLVAERGALVDEAGAVAPRPGPGCEPGPGGCETAVLGAVGDALAGPGQGTGRVGAAI